MQDMIVTVNLLNDEATVPSYGTERSAGADLYAAEDIVFYPGMVQQVATGVQMHIPEGYHGRIEARSGMASKGMVVLTGVIDEDYRGELKVIMTFLGANQYNGMVNRFEVKRGDRIAQLVFRQSAHAGFVLGDVSADTSRGAGGFGSTGTR